MCIAEAVASGCRQRWKVEDFSHVLKSECKVQDQAGAAAARPASPARETPPAAGGIPLRGARRCAGRSHIHSADYARIRPDPGAEDRRRAVLASPTVLRHGGIDPGHPPERSGAILHHTPIPPESAADARWGALCARNGHSGRGAAARRLPDR